MNEYRKLLMRKIDHAFAQGKYPFFYGICGMGKHEALHGYAQRQKRACKTLNGEMPDDPSCIYMIDQFDDERYLRRLCEALKTQTACHVCFISEHMLPACMYELMLERIQLFPADDFCFSLSECQRLLRSEHLDEEQIKAIFLHSDGCLAAIRYHLRREQEDLERYWTAYLSHCYQLFSDAQQKLMHQLSTIGSLEREGAQELLQADPEMLRQLVNAGMLREEAGILRVPACLRWPLSEDEALLDSLFEYHLRKGQIVRAWRCARSLSLQEKLFTLPNEELVWNAAVEEITGEAFVTGVQLLDTQTKEERFVAADGIFIAVGIQPVSESFKSLVKTDEAGYICAGEDCCTSVPGIFAVGDVRTKKLRQIVTAVADGANAVNSVQEYFQTR